MKSLPIAVFCLIAHTSILLSSDASYARDKSELQYLVAQGDAEAQYQLANHLMKGLGECDADRQERCNAISALDAAMWLKIVRQHTFPRSVASRATIAIKKIERASGILGNRLGLFQIVTDKLASSCIEKFYFQCGFHFDKELFPRRTEENIVIILRRAKGQKR
ncbi:MAG: hypothetical protein CFH10_01714 [Alphaproteobacteria bacterium MarineAlpha4_Bin2]|nr:MAG: hypothetical protein CFH10_01714 [Alphaproteobacteria bacterium MarineAlpha4_Bin2]